jgi:hypothetical protein
LFITIYIIFILFFEIRKKKEIKIRRRGRIGKKRGGGGRERERILII